MLLPHGHVHVHLPHEEHEGGHDWMAIAAAVLLALATVASAWGAYQSARWGGYEAKQFAAATSDRIKSSKAADLADQEMAVDREIWVDWINAYGSGQTRLTAYYENNVFSEELKKAFEAWIATDPQNNPSAPDSPFETMAYSNENMEKSIDLEERAQEETLEAREAVEQSDKYVLFTVLFASVLFFAGISTKFGARNVRLAVLIMGSVLFTGSLIAIVIQPIR
jgi:hypothetical protein